MIRLDTICSQKAVLEQVFRLNSVYVTRAHVIHQNMPTTRKHMQSGAVCAHVRITLTRMYSTHTHTVLINVEHMQTAAVNHIEILMYKTALILNKTKTHISTHSRSK